MILSDKQILELMDKGEMGIEGFEEENLTPNGYDLTIEEISVEGELFEDGVVEIEPESWFAVSTREYVKFPSNVAGELWIRTTWARKGVLASFGMIDAGFEGTLTLSAYNTHQKVELPIGETFAQMVFHLMNDDSDKLYSERSGNYQSQKGVNL